jgi:hypothetical protein
MAWRRIMSERGWSKDEWVKGSNRMKYAHLRPELVHVVDGKKVGWDTLNRGFRYIDPDNSRAFIGSPRDLPRRTRVSDTEFISVYQKCKTKNLGMEHFIKDLGYYRNNIQGIRVRLSEVNRRITSVLEGALGKAEAQALVAGAGTSPLLRGLKSKFTLRGRKSKGGVDSKGILAALKKSGLL